MRNKPLKGLIKRSPIKTNYNFTAAKDYSPGATKGLPGDKLASALTPKTMIDVLPVGSKIYKFGKLIKNFIA
tara:strand:+ start:344 stop:559 length:216 start_codon:yes stop_codon:yes gene_type:complete